VDWYLWGVVAGLFLPWFIMTPTLMGGFSVNVQRGFSVWMSIAALTVPISLLGMWIIMQLAG